MCGKKKLKPKDISNAMEAEGATQAETKAAPKTETKAPAATGTKK